MMVMASWHGLLREGNNQVGLHSLYATVIDDGEDATISG